MRERLIGYQQEIEGNLWATRSEVISAGLVDSQPAAQDARTLFLREDVDLTICYVGTYATSSQVVPAVQRLPCPVLVLNLQPVPALDYHTTDTGEWLANCCACCVPEISCAFARCGIGFNVVSGLLREEDGEAGRNAWREIRAWIKAAAAARRLRQSRLGFLGHTYPGMLDMYADFTMITGQTGVHIEVLEIDDLQTRVDQVTEDEIEGVIARTRKLFEISSDSPSDPLAKAPQPEALAWSAKVAAGLDRLVADFQLDALSYYYRGADGNPQEVLGAGLILGNTLLTGRGVPCSGEGDTKNAIAMLIMDRLEAGGSFTELYAMDFVDQFLLMGHDGPFHLAIAEGKPNLRGLGLYHGKRGRGISVEARVKAGPVTILGLTQTGKGNLKMLVAEGQSIPGPILRIGNTNSRIRFSIGPAEFMDAWCVEGPTHHCALGLGHVANEIEKVARIVGLEVIRVASGRI
ncbi:MAG TPA: L-fucose/L-arabinose isomerase family protein [Chthoniobacterales bacterium]|nr:L-fucose/L-arabinose isomerase family protein [Chthoniobacterales bacterium]